MNSPSLSGLTFFESQLEMPLTTLPLRSTKVSFGGANILISPLPSWTLKDFRSLGSISDVVAPNLFHHLGARKAAEAFPQARLWGAPGLQEKRPRLPWHGTFGRDSWPYERELQAIPIKGLAKFNEVVFFHVASKTLICTDLMFNLQNVRGIGARVIFGVMGTYRRPAVSRLLKMMVSDKALLQDSLRQIMALDIENIVMAHGDTILGNGSAVFKRAFETRGLL